MCHDSKLTFFHKAEYCDTPQSKERRNGEYKVCLNEGALRLLDHDVTWKSVFFPAPERGDFSKESGILQIGERGPASCAAQRSWIGWWDWSRRILAYKKEEDRTNVRLDYHAFFFSLLRLANPYMRKGKLGSATVKSRPRKSPVCHAFCAI